MRDRKFIYKPTPGRNCPSPVNLTHLPSSPHISTPPLISTRHSHTIHGLQCFPSHYQRRRRARYVALMDILDDDRLLNLSLSEPWQFTGPEIASQNRVSNALDPVDIPSTSGVYGHVHIQPQPVPSPSTSTGLFSGYLVRQNSSHKSPSHILRCSFYIPGGHGA